MDIDLWQMISAFGSFLGGIAGLFAAFIAFRALNIWKASHNYQFAWNTANDVAKQLKAIVNEIDEYVKEINSYDYRIARLTNPLEKQAYYLSLESNFDKLLYSLTTKFIALGESKCVLLAIINTKNLQKIDIPFLSHDESDKLFLKVSSVLNTVNKEFMENKKLTQETKGNMHQLIVEIETFAKDLRVEFLKLSN